MTTKRDDSGLSSSFKIVEAPDFQKKMESSAFRRLYAKIEENAYPKLRGNPFSGPNIKRSKGERLLFSDIESGITGCCTQSIMKKARACPGLQTQERRVPIISRFPLSFLNLL